MAERSWARLKPPVPCQLEHCCVAGQQSVFCYQKTELMTSGSSAALLFAVLRLSAIVSSCQMSLAKLKLPNDCRMMNATRTFSCWTAMHTFLLCCPSCTKLCENAIMCMICMIMTSEVDFEMPASKSLFLENLHLAQPLTTLSTSNKCLKKPTRWFAMSQQELRTLRGIVFSQLDTLQALTQMLFTKVELFRSGVVKNKGEHEETEKELQNVKALLAGL